MKTLGEKIRYFRERAGLSQFKLGELIDSASGSLSRIENGEVNPTKESLRKIVRVLNLKLIEASDMFEIEDTTPTKEDTINAINKIKSRFQKDNVYAVLLDFYWNIIYVSKSFVEAAGVPESMIAHFLPVHFFEIQLSNNFGLVVKNSEEYMIHDLADFRGKMKSTSQIKFMNVLVKKLSVYPTFKRAWKRSMSINESYVGMAKREVFLTVKEKQFKLLPFFKPLVDDPRFEILDYYLS